MTWTPKFKRVWGLYVPNGNAVCHFVHFCDIETTLRLTLDSVTKVEIERVFDEDDFDPNEKSDPTYDDRVADLMQDAWNFIVTYTNEYKKVVTETFEVWRWELYDTAVELEPMGWRAKDPRDRDDSRDDPRVVEK